MNVLCSLLLVIASRRTFATHSTQHSPLYQHFTLAVITNNQQPGSPAASLAARRVARLAHSQCIRARTHTHTHTHTQRQYTLTRAHMDTYVRIYEFCDSPRKLKNN